MTTNFVTKLHNPLHLSHLHSKTEWNIATSMCALTCVNDDSVSCKNIVNFSPVSPPELTELICEPLARHSKNWFIQPNISVYTGL